jgi:hypothetical protein
MVQRAWPMLIAREIACIHRNIKPICLWLLVFGVRSPETERTLYHMSQCFLLNVKKSMSDSL